jgi:phage major head subunit gpT-like protein
MIVTNATLEALRTNFYANFQKGLVAAPSLASRFMMPITSSTKINTYGWLEKLPKMRKWLGPRVVNNLSERAYQLANDDWEETVGVPENDIEDDNLGHYALVFQQMGMAVSQLADQQLTLLKENGHDTAYAAAIGYDGLPFYSASHVIGGAAPATQSNYRTNKPLTHDNYQEARAAFMQTKGFDGEVFALIPDVLEVPPALEKTGKQILNAEMVSDGSVAVTNVNRGSAELVVNPRLTDATDWYLHYTGGALKPFIHQMRRAARFVRKDAPTDDNVFERKEYLYGIDSREAFGVALWWFSQKNKGEA